jgi:hypothetical protein
MSQRLISRSADLRRLQDDGYHIEIRSGCLLLHSVPYVTAAREVKRGVLISPLDLAGDVTQRPSTHLVYFAGEYPCTTAGTPITAIRHGSGTIELGPGIVAQHSFSNKPAGGYADYYEKMTRYVTIISDHAAALDPTATARTHPLIGPEEEDEDSVFHYQDNATSRAGIGAFTRRLTNQRIAIVGIGGTGAYVLDLIAKTPVREIHLYDGDVFSQHNAFRSPGTAAREELERRPNKASHFAAQYARMHRHVVPHPEYVTADNIGELQHMDFVFVCVDNGEARRLIVHQLEAFGVAFVDVGIGVYMTESGLGGVVRVTTSTPTFRDHVHARQRIPFTGDDEHNEYSRNVQIADLNALNATLAVIKWKKLLRFYVDLEREHFTTYTVGGNDIANEEQGEGDEGDRGDS